jgi:hypothetical protein
VQSRFVILCGFLLLSAAGCGDDADPSMTGESDTDASSETDDAGEPTGEGPQPAQCTPSRHAFDVDIETIPSVTGSGTTAASYVQFGMFETDDAVDLLVAREVEDPSDEEGAHTSIEWLGLDGSGGVIATAPGRFQGYVTTVFAAAPVVGFSDARCVVFSMQGQTLRMACDDGLDEDTGIDVGEEELHPVVNGDGSVSVFGQTSAAFTEIRRDVSGAWSEIDKFQSSVSMPGDAMSVDGTPLACFFSETSGSAAFDFGGVEFGAFEATDCHLALEGETVHVLTDTGYARTSAGVGWAVNDVPVTTTERVIEFFAVDDTAYVVTQARDLSSIELASVPNGTVETVSGHLPRSPLRPRSSARRPHRSVLWCPRGASRPALPHHSSA